jgi:phosphate butyryltransferase
VTSKLPETELAYSVCNNYIHHKEFNIEGPVSLDIAISQDASVKKGIHSHISGEADVLIGPSISASNMIVKALMSLGGSKGGGIILGAKCPIVLLSRSDIIDTKLNSIALSLMMLKRGRNGYYR